VPVAPQESERRRAHRRRRNPIGPETRGSTVMTRAAVARYTTQMVPFGSALTALQINEIAAYVYRVTHR
jgi:hypothetical protein